MVARAAELHDVGKIAIPERVLRKRGPLTAVERELIRKHTLIGERILAAAPAMVPVARLVRSSHERWDGDGYPDRLAGERDPARRAHHRGLRRVRRDGVEEALPAQPRLRSQALEELRRCSGTQFDPRLVRAVLRARAPAGGRLGRGAPRVAARSGADTGTGSGPTANDRRPARSGQLPMAARLEQWADDA